MTPSMAQTTIALIGATGRTGSEFLRLALDEGFTVKALVRSPSKVTIDDERLTVLEGDLHNVEALEKVTEGATYVVCMAAASTIDGDYPKEFMFNFVKRLYPILQKSPPRVFLYQAGSMSTDGNGFLHPIAWIMKHTLGRRLNIFDKIDDNNAVIRFIGTNSSNFSFIVTRAGVLKEGPASSTHVHLSNVVSSGLKRLVCLYSIFTGSSMGCDFYTHLCAHFVLLPPSVPAIAMVSSDIYRPGGLHSQGIEGRISIQHLSLCSSLTPL